MPLQKFQIYDVIVDIIPGIMFVGLLIPLLTPANTSNPVDLNGGIGIAILILAVGYVFGRVVHSVASLLDSVIRRTITTVYVQMMNGPGSEDLFRIYNRISPFIGNNYSFDQHIRDAFMPTSDDFLKTSAAAKFIEKIETNYDIGPGDSGKDPFGFEGPSDGYEHFAHSLLYNRQVLYRRYEILTTFFRSLYVMFLVFGIAYTGATFRIIGYFEQEMVWHSIVENYPNQALLILMGMFMLSIIFAHQRRKFSHRKGRALLYDSIIVMSENN